MTVCAKMRILITGTVGEGLNSLRFTGILLILTIISLGCFATPAETLIGSIFHTGGDSAAGIVNFKLSGLRSVAVRYLNK